MKTLIIYEDIENPIKFHIVEGDYSKFNGIMVNSGEEHPETDNFCNWMWKEDGNDFEREWSTDIKVIEDKNWDKVAIVTFLP